MTSRTLPRWAPVLTLMLLGAAFAPRPAQAAATATPAVPAAATARHDAASPLCITEAFAYGAAVGTYINAWNDYNDAVRGGDPATILKAAERIDLAATAVLDTGLLLVKCLATLL